MKPKTLILMVVAVTCGLGASYMTSRLLAQRNQSETEEKVQILVAVKNLDQGKTIKVPEQDFEFKEFLIGSEPKDAVKDVADLKGRVLNRTLRQGEPVSKEDLISEDKLFLSFKMPPGYRAIGVRVTNVSGVAGFATLPLTRVDVITTVRRGSDRDSFSRILLEDVLVLAIDQNDRRPDGETRAMPGHVAILALKPDEMLKVRLAEEQGALSLALRKFNDKGKSDIDRVTWEEIMTNRTGKDVDLAEESPGQPPTATAKLPKLPTDVTPKTPDIVITEDTHKVHVLTIIEGENHKTGEYLLDDKGAVVPREVVRTELSTTPPRPAPAATGAPIAPPRPPEPSTPPVH